MGYSRDPRHLYEACHCKPGTPSSDLLYLDFGDKPQSRYGEESSHIGEEALPVSSFSVFHLYILISRLYLRRLDLPESQT